MPEKNDAHTLMARLQDHGLFQELVPALHEALAAELEWVTLPAEAYLFRQGDPGDSMYVLDKGALRVVLTTDAGEQSVLSVLARGDMVGELAVLSGQARSADVQAIVDCSLIRISSQSLDHLTVKHPEIRRRIADMALPRFKRTQFTGVFNHFFGELGAVELDRLQQQMSWRHVASGEAVFEQGDHGNYMAFVVNGRLRVAIEEEDGERKAVREIGRGNVVGEMSLLTGQPRSATVYAVRDTDLMILTTETFRRISADYPPLVMELARIVAERATQRESVGRAHARSTMSLALVPYSSEVPLREFSRQLSAQLRALGRTISLDAARFDQRFGREGAAQTPEDDVINIAITGWLNQQEMAHQYVVFVADEGWTPWTERCLKQADRILLVAEAQSSTDKNLIEKKLAQLGLQAKVELVLIQPSELERPQGTAAWLKGRDVYQYHHLRLGRESDLGRLARRITGRALGLVLGGGAARGLAHVGVFRALQEAGIEIDVLGGTSIGGLVAANIAMDRDYSQLKTLAREYTTPENMQDRTYPAVALNESKKVTELMRTLFGETQIEDLFRPFFCVSSNLTQSRPQIHRQGPLWLATRASIAIPGIFTPIHYEGDILVDGMLMSSLPIDIMRDTIGNGRVIAVDPSPVKEKKREWEFGPSISGWEVMRRRLNPLEKRARVPTLIGTLLHGLNVNSHYRLQSTHQHADLLIQLDTSAHNMMAWDAHEALIRIGYESAQEALASWPR